MFAAPKPRRVGSFSEPDVGGTLGTGLEEAYTPELREKMVRLEKANQILRRRLDSTESHNEGIGMESGWS